jgi:hypothetical protein
VEKKLNKIEAIGKIWQKNRAKLKNLALFRKIK